MDDKFTRTALLLGEAGMHKLKRAHVILFGVGGVGGYAAEALVIDAVDNVTAKIELALRAKAAGAPIIACMGAGNKLDASRFEVSDIYRTSVCPLAKVMRRELKKRGVDSLKVVYSKEEPIKAGISEEGRRSTPGSVAFVPSVAGLILAGEVVKDICKR